MSLTLNGWKSATAILVTHKLPLQDYQSALNMAGTYLSDTGGWVPNDEDDPTGEGNPANGEDTDQASSNIALSQYQRMYSINSTERLTVEINIPNNLTEGQPDSTVMASSRDEIESFIRAQLEGTDLNLIDIENESFYIVNRGQTIPSDRVDIKKQLDIVGNKLVDPRIIGLELAIDRYMLDDTYNVSSFYLEDETDLVIVVRKYTDTSYGVLDNTSLLSYVLTMDLSTYTLSTGLVRPSNI